MSDLIVIELALTRAEAQTLRDILGGCSGDRILSRNRHVRAIWQALKENGFPKQSKMTDLIGSETSIHFYPEGN